MEKKFGIYGFKILTLEIEIAAGCVNTSPLGVRIRAKYLSNVLVLGFELYQLFGNFQSSNRGIYRYSIINSGPDSYIISGHNHKIKDELIYFSCQIKFSHEYCLLK